MKTIFTRWNILLTLFVLVFSMFLVDIGLLVYRRSPFFANHRNVRSAESAVLEVGSSDSINLSNNNLTEIPGNLFLNSELTFLDLSNNKIEKVPTKIQNLENLEVLNLVGNNLDGALPAEIRHLKKLRILDLSTNNFTGVPAEIGQLENLELLNLANNSITGLPHEIGNLKNLRVLDISGNDVSQQDIDVIMSALPKLILVQDTTPSNSESSQ